MCSHVGLFLLDFEFLISLLDNNLWLPWVQGFVCYFGTGIDKELFAVLNICLNLGSFYSSYNRRFMKWLFHNELLNRRHNTNNLLFMLLHFEALRMKEERRP